VCAKLNAITGGEHDLPTGRGPTITETIGVPSSEHVAEIVGRQGRHSEGFELLHFHPIYSINSSC
jgi:hypothetical protein